MILLCVPFVVNIFDVQSQFVSCLLLIKININLTTNSRALKNYQKNTRKNQPKSQKQSLKNCCSLQFSIQLSSSSAHLQDFLFRENSEVLFSFMKMFIFLLFNFQKQFLWSSKNLNEEKPKILTMSNVAPPHYTHSTQQ